jgi:hypothetical protein
MGRISREVSVRVGSGVTEEEVVVEEARRVVAPGVREVSTTQLSREMWRKGDGCPTLGD